MDDVFPGSVKHRGVSRLAAVSFDSAGNCPRVVVESWLSRPLAAIYDTSPVNVFFSERVGSYLITNQLVSPSERIR